MIFKALNENFNDMKTMKRTTLTLLFIALFISSAFAQVGRIERTKVEHADNRVEALTVTMKPERKDIQKAFDDWMDDRYDVKMKGGGLFSDKNMERAEAVVIPAISTDNITLFAKTEETDCETRMTLFASRGLGNYIGADEYKAFAGLENVFDGFLSDYLPEYYEERVAEAREELEELRKDVTDTEDDIADNEKKIEKLRGENLDKRKELIELEKKVSDARKMLEEREKQRRKVNRSVAGS